MGRNDSFLSSFPLKISVRIIPRHLLIVELPLVSHTLVKIKLMILNTVVQSNPPILKKKKKYSLLQLPQYQLMGKVTLETLRVVA